MCIVILKLEQLFAHIGVSTERGPKCCVPIPALPFQEKNIIFIIHNAYFLKVRADEKFCSKPETKEENMETARERERERERERGDNSLYPVLHLSL